MPAPLPVPPSRSAEEWDFLQLNVLKPSRSSKVCITCQRFRYEVDRHCVTLLTCPIHQGLIPQGEHLTKRCFQWVARQKVRQGWCPEGGLILGAFNERRMLFESNCALAEYQLAPIIALLKRFSSGPVGI